MGEASESPVSLPLHDAQLLSVSVVSPGPTGLGQLHLQFGSPSDSGGDSRAELQLKGVHLLELAMNMSALSHVACQVESAEVRPISEQVRTRIVADGASIGLEKLPESIECQIDLISPAGHIFCCAQHYELVFSSVA